MVNSIKIDVLSITNPPKIGISLVSFFLVFQSFFSNHVSCYQPAEDFAIKCGSSVDESSFDRTWHGDINSTLFILIEPQNNPASASISVVAPPDPSANKIPYGNARLSHAEFTYSFQVTDGQKFVRLYFNPAEYPKVQRYNALFSVKAGRYTLLKDFNASITADNDEDSQPVVFREYCINVDADQRLNITFTPSPENRDAYAFVNGIEIVSMPTDLYYTKPEDQRKIKMVGQDEGHYYQIMNSSALQMMYRINVGGSQIPPEGDAGLMFRYWHDETGYLKKRYPESEPVVIEGARPKYTEQVPNYTAPDLVYLTARSYGRGATSRYNVTWNFRVDPEFIYVVRLHFCEFELQGLEEKNLRVFQIFINDIMVEPYADVIAWSGGSLIPVYKEYAFLLWNGSAANLSIKLQPHPRSKSVRDIILNGIEIFKVSSDGDNLGGPNPDLLSSPTLPLPPPIIPSKPLKRTMIVAIVVGIVFGSIVLSVIALSIFRRKSATDNYDKDSRRGKNALAPAKSSKAHGSSLPSGLCRYFPIDEIRAATNDFNDVLKIGVGGFGIVYKGYIDDNTTPVAIKRLKPGSQQGAVEFKTEIEMLSQLRHLHLVSLIGYCDDGNEMILVYDFMARGTLREHLYGSDNAPLSWKQRLQICLGAARGLDHLHTGAKHNIIHRDVKSTNILLDEKWVAKVSDFGLSKSEPIGMTKSHISTIVKGSLGYLDPEYYKRQRLTQKSDVYSFGVVLLEVLCGRPPLLRTVEKNQTNLVDWFRKCHKNGEIDRVIDPNLRGTITPKCLNKFTEMALSCLLEDGSQRPSMNDLVWGLEFALQLQETREDSEIGRVQVDGKSQEMSLLPKFVNESSEESAVQFTSTNVSIDDSKNSKVTVTSVSSEEQALISGSVFSEIRDPTAR